MSKKIIVANWKMNIPDLKSWRGFRAPKNTEAVICTPFPYLYHVSRITYHDKNLKLGAQDCFWEEKGAYTGEVSPTMLKDMGAEYVILGHSERRRWLGETDEMINKKVKAALRAGLKVILCVGEPLAVRRRGLAAAKRFIANQLHKDLTGVKKSLNPQSSILNSRLVVAYEPIWATGRADKPEDSAEMAKFIKGLTAKIYNLKPRILYGGSVNSKNAKKFLEQKEIDGALVGGASLDAGEFDKIVKFASKVGQKKLRKNL